MRKLAIVLLALAACSGLADGVTPIDAFDSTCAEILCGWDVKSGTVAPTGSWHEHQRAIGLEGQPALISKGYKFVQHIECVSFDFLAKIDSDAQLTLELDFDDDGSVDTSAPVPAVRWRRFDLGLRAPAEYTALRVNLRKEGPGEVRIAQLIINSNPEHCTAQPPTRLADGAVCSTDSTCTSGRCVLGRCASCAAGGCGEGEGCRSSDECRDGACAAGVCRACAKQGSCATNQGCSIGGQCASGSCSFGARPSTTVYPGSDGVCGDCNSDGDCGTGFCVLGYCSACRVDGDCTGDLVCRYTDTFDVGTRACMPRITSVIPRGGLCESSGDCEPGLSCGAVDGRAKRCGFACLRNSDCGGSTKVCGTSGVTTIVEAPATLTLLPDWKKGASGRVATCYDSTASKCEVQEQCSTFFAVSSIELACCSGKCTHAVLDSTTGMCDGPSN